MKRAILIACILLVSGYVDAGIFGVVAKKAKFNNIEFECVKVAEEAPPALPTVIPTADRSVGTPIIDTPK
jgi:hypothetical protein